MIYKMKLLENEFNNIKHNGKILEVRLNDEKRKNIKSGDEIIFYKLPYMKEYIGVYVEQVYVFSSFLEVYTKFPKEYFGYSNISMEEIMKKIYTIYTKEQEKVKGVMVIKFRVESKSYQ
ncbi:ASCH domain-containing protein [Anaerosalibacter bizertensis]|uniref:ASCH domain-containing protein n=1 Tax=Anaerosalibacter bizertensis TaxID=932217 RepID=A0A9Q4FM99_9FIRM|nr:ASCH domain-containing protein [Anaerosalibacter bizertensis]MBV1821232.1 ASCH domain-containing protein [Bacteroidales bacterium MSK.15.36]MCG4565465.1 ASCH domain-containing protein [Anaerosalibacter bizertensis]MCG4583298.1 ASCH domain-containing protein [Anaerosalibacter bizertensis]